MNNPRAIPARPGAGLCLLALVTTLLGQPQVTPEPPSDAAPPETRPATVESPPPAEAANQPAATRTAEIEAQEPLPSEHPIVRQFTPIPGLLRIGGEGIVAAHEEAPEVVMVFGKGTIAGRVQRDMVVVFGAARIDGEVGGDLVAPFSRIELGPQARVRGDLVAVFGSLTAHPEARVEGQRIDMSWEQLEGVPGMHAVKNLAAGFANWLELGLMKGRLLPASWGWWWSAAIAMAFGYVLITLFAPKAVQAGATQLESRPVACFFVGILGYLLANVLLVFLGSTVIGILAWPFVLMALLVVQVAGKASLYQSVGIRLGHQLGSTTLSTPLPALLAGLALFTAIFMIPLIGLLAWLLVAPVGLGAALLAMFRNTPPPAHNPDPAPLAIPRPPAPAPISVPADWLNEPLNPTPPPPPIAGPPPVIGSRSFAYTEAELTSLPRAGFWIRTAATLLDLLVILVPLALIRLPDYFLIPWIAYHVAFWTWRGTTVGGVICRLRVIRLDGQPLNFAVALVRSLASFLSAILLFLGFFWVGWKRERLSWHDRIAGTAIVRMPPGISLL